MKWDIRLDDWQPPKGTRILLDGEPVRCVYAFDTEAGWLAHYLERGGKKFMVEENGERVAAYAVLRGKVTVEEPNGTTR